jgi:hypothetical protein
MDAEGEYDRRTEGHEVRSIELARALAGAAAGAAVVATSVSARTGEPCVKVRPSGALTPAWSAAVEELRRQLAELKAADCRPMAILVDRAEQENDVGPHARQRAEPDNDAAVRVLAVTPDGQRTERTVVRPESLVATVLGLVIAVPSGPPAAASAPPPPAPPAPSGWRPSIPPPSHDTRPSEPVPAVRAPVVVPRTVALWTGLSAGVRLTAPTDLTVLDFEARVDLLLSPWLLIATVRSAVASCTGRQGVDCDVYTDVSTGVGVGRRFETGPAAVDVAIEPSIVAMHMEYDFPAGFEGAPIEGTEVALRVDASARLAVPLSPSWALTVTVDGGLSPALLMSPSQLAIPGGAPNGSSGPPPFPAWMGGVRIGASGALL